MSFEDSTVLITGGSKGIGLEIAKVFAANSNHPLLLVARNESDLLSAKSDLENLGAKKVDILSLDLSDSVAIKKANFGSYNIGILINNAGSYLYNLLENTSIEQFESQFKINSLSAFALTQEILPSLKKMERALIVNICSQASLRGYADSGAYSMSKHALLGYTRSLCKELYKTNIAVSAINLGQTFSDSWKGIDVDVEKLIDPVDVGQIILTLSKLSKRTVAEEINIMPQGGEIPPM